MNFVYFGEDLKCRVSNWFRVNFVFFDFVLRGVIVIVVEILVESLLLFWLEELGRRMSLEYR